MELALALEKLVNEKLLALHGVSDNNNSFFTLLCLSSLSENIYYVFIHLIVELKASKTIYVVPHSNKRI